MNVRRAYRERTERAFMRQIWLSPEEYANKAASEEAMTGWDAVIKSLSDYAANARNIGTYGACDDR
jgi:hypothetical protein